ncbi:hypothetical protein PybrP1_006143 [[Pythium] brassicae (nom. inval.)]|nr:hypothetical protein PybrP1_006143 [[Pythium] brassicae (nom. inval.)]
MVLFTEAETLLLLDLYLRLRLWPRNVASNGVLLRAPARSELTRAINRASAGRDGRSWTEAQVFVKFKNLRIDYGLVRWLQEQPGFKRNGEGMTEDWWVAIKSQRPKAHVFKGRLPWPFYSRMAMILLDAPYEPVTDPLMTQRLSELLEEDAETTAMAAALSAAPALAGPGPSGTSSDDDAAGPEVGSEPPAPLALVSPPPPPPVVAVDALYSPPAAGKRSSHTLIQAAPVPQPQQPPAKRSRASSSSNSSGGSPGGAAAERPDALSRSVEQCSAAAAGMARGFQELVGVFQAQALKCQQLEAAAGGAGDVAVRDQRQVLLSIARSLEQSTQATADMAKGYHDLVQHYIEEAAARRS